MVIFSLVLPPFFLPVFFEIRSPFVFLSISLTLSFLLKPFLSPSFSILFSFPFSFYLNLFLSPSFSIFFSFPFSFYLNFFVSLFLYLPFLFSPPPLIFPLFPRF